MGSRAGEHPAEGQRFYLSHSDVARYLSSNFCGLTIRPIHEAITAGLLEFRNKTKYHTRSYKGASLQGETFGALRGLLAEDGWTADERTGFAYILAPDGKRAIAVRTGCPRTGSHLFEPFPRTRNRNGPLTDRIVEENFVRFQELSLFPDSVTPIHRPTAPPFDTYFLLIHYDKGDRVRPYSVRSELSWPYCTEGDEGRKRISGYIHRVIMPVVPNDPGRRPGSRPEVAPVADAPVSRRAS